jgi:hypothetical protein
MFRAAYQDWLMRWFVVGGAGGFVAGPFLSKQSANDVAAALNGTKA